MPLRAVSTPPAESPRANLAEQAYAQLKAMLQTNTGEADLRDLHASLVATPLKPRMQHYVASRE